MEPDKTSPTQARRHRFILSNLLFLGSTLARVLLVLLLTLSIWVLHVEQTSYAWLLILLTGLISFVCMHIANAGWALFTGKSTALASLVSYIGVGIFLLIMATTSWIDPYLIQKTVPALRFYAALSFQLLLGAALFWRGVSLLSSGAYILSESEKPLDQA